MQKELTDRERGLYLREIKDDLVYFRRTYLRAHITVNIAGWSPDDPFLSRREHLLILAERQRFRPLARGLNHDVAPLGGRSFERVQHFYHVHS
jgi:hypothetical protein